MRPKRNKPSFFKQNKPVNRELFPEVEKPPIQLPVEKASETEEAQPIIGAKQCH